MKQMGFSLDAPAMIKEVAGWYIEVRSNSTMTALEIRCSGNVIGESEMIIRPCVANSITVSSTASEQEVKTTT